MSQKSIVKLLFYSLALIAFFVLLWCCMLVLVLIITFSKNIGGGGMGGSCSPNFLIFLVMPFTTLSFLSLALTPYIYLGMVIARIIKKRRILIYQESLMNESGYVGMRPQPITYKAVKVLGIIQISFLFLQAIFN